MTQAELDGLQDLRKVDLKTPGASQAAAFRALRAVPRLLDEVAHCREFFRTYGVKLTTPMPTTAPEPKKEDAK
jgi:hypothetical protein